MPGDRTGDYVFGHSDHELDRLHDQGRLYEPITREIFTRAGLAPGMHVLDLGCGAGDVSLLAAKMVGPGGAVLGIDRAPEAIATTQARAKAAGIGWIEVETHDLGDLHLTRSFDAIVGRLALCYIPHRVDLLRRLKTMLRPGGLMAFVEMDVSAGGSKPSSPLIERCGRLIYATMRANGFEPNMGSRLFAAFREAGLAAELAAFGVAAGGRDSMTIPYLCEVIRSLLPMIEQAGLATSDEIDLDTLAERLRDEPGVESRTFYLPRLTGAWTRVP